ncbi:MAG: hypothetical protein WBD40_03275 [Tepidisphaeraceae bacterium]
MRLHTIRHIVALASVLIAASVTSSCGTGGAEAQDSTASPTDAFKNTVYADMAGDERHLWVLVAGHDLDDTPNGMRVYERNVDQRDWRELPPIPWTTLGRGSFAIAGWRGRPCVTVPRSDPRSGDVMMCLFNDEWRSITDDSPLDHQTIDQLTAYDDALFAITTSSQNGTRRTSHAIYRWDRERWQRLGAPVQAQSGIAALGQTGSGGLAPDLLIESTGGRPASRAIYRLSGGTWKAVGDRIEDASIGPNVSGPVTRAGTTWVAVTEANRTPWRFSVLRRTSSSGRWHRRALNISRGNAQGAVYPGHAGTWAIWVESLPRNSRAVPFSERIWAARLDTAGSRPISLHSGLSIGPGDITISDGAGGTWALYMTTTPSHGLRAVVRALPGR